MADAWHHRADELSSIGVFIGIFGSIIGIKILEPISLYRNSSFDYEVSC